MCRKIKGAKKVWNEIEGQRRVTEWKKEREKQREEGNMYEKKI